MRRLPLLRALAVCGSAIAMVLLSSGAAISGQGVGSTEGSPAVEDLAVTEGHNLETIDDIDLRSGEFAPAPPMNAEPQAVSRTIEAGGCHYRQAVDNAHITRGAASVHGWWLSVGGSCPDKADVTTLL